MEEGSKSRKRASKRRRIALRKWMATFRAEKEAASKRLVEQETAEREKRTRRNREKKVKRKERERAKKAEVNGSGGGVVSRSGRPAAENPDNDSKQDEGS